MATNRPEYRNARTPRAVRVYTIAQESRYLLIENVPALNLEKELLTQCAAFGNVESLRIIPHHPGAEEFTDVFWLQYATLSAARRAKRALDDSIFFANLLRVSYAPEHETMQDARQKLQERRLAVAYHRQRPSDPVQKTTAHKASAAKETGARSTPASFIGPQLPSPGEQPAPAPKKQRRRI